MNKERDEHGRFADGNSGGPGRPARQTEREYLRALAGACSVDDWQQIIQRAVADAKGGDAAARTWLGKYVVGEPGATAPTLRQLAVEEAAGGDPLQGELDDALLMRALARARGAGD